MNENLYFIANSGCDATTYGLARIPEEDFPNFKTMIENLNHNSTYGCMPTISVYKISMNDLREVNYDFDAECMEENEDISEEELFFLDGKVYTFADYYFSYYTKLECVIEGRSRFERK